jgi:rod shape-determining protein MreC
MQSVGKRRLSFKVIYPLIFFIVVSSLLFFYRNSNFVLTFEGFVQNILSKPKSVFYSFGRGEDNGKLQKVIKENQDLEQKLADYKLLEKDNEALRSQFETTGITSSSLISSKIVGFLGERNSPTTLIINAGKLQGVQKGMGVVFEKNLVGKVSDVSNNFSVVKTSLNPDFKTLAVLADTNADGILEGKNDFLLLDKVVITDNLVKNGVVVTKGEVNEKGVGILPDIVIGKISSISKNETSPFQSAQVIPLIDFSKLTEVFVVKSL